MIRFIASLALLLMFCLPVAAQQGQQYTPLVLPAPPGAQGSDTRASALNNSGQVFGLAGLINFGQFSFVPVLWTDGVPSILPPPTGSGYHFIGGGDGLGYDFINDSGTVVSLAINDAVAAALDSTGRPAFPNDGRRPIIWQNGMPTVLRELPSDQTCTQYAAANGVTGAFGVTALDRLNSRPLGLNAQGHILVYACGAFWIWNGGSFQLLVTQQVSPFVTPAVSAPGGKHLNDSDHAVLEMFVPGAPIGSQPLYVPAIYSLGGTTPLPITPQANLASHSINNSDQVLFFFQDVNAGSSHLKLWDGTQVVDIGPGGFASLNNLGQVVFDTGFPSSSRIYKDGVVSPLNVPPPANGNVSSTFLLNDAGQIAESTSLTVSQPYAVLFTPTTTTKADQTITFAPITGKTYGDAPFTVNATASSGLPVSFQIASGPATISGNLVTITGAGMVTVTASQAGNSSYNAAPNASQMFPVSPALPAITWMNPADIVYGTALSATQLNATASVGGSFSYSPASGTLLNAGMNQPLLANFTPTDTTNYNAVSKGVQINVLKATPLFSNLSSPAIVYGTATTSLTGKISFGSLIPTGSVAITLNGVTQNAPIQAGGTFSSDFATGSLAPVNPPYGIAYNYSGDGNFNPASGSGTLTASYNTLPLYDQTQAHHSGSMIPIRLEVTSATGSNLSSPDLVVTAVGVSMISSAANGPVVDSGNAAPDSNFRFDSGMYIYNFRTTGLATGVYNLYFRVGTDPTQHTVQFQIR